ncbi:S8 family serine peptidase (plasmid) [Pedobacter sp. BS3]|uniref:S8/S53 family peptidase n=1 Tax=Pedobacter sp. BS3 TaxID=2567937 RepID=UPI0011EEE4D1|nr:S8/S53 family peptidase [Pedobacter sp. BS3]TZF85995.1 S8 family serine peptidase [Pedobacter sp. BS3]
MKKLLLPGILLSVLFTYAQPKPALRTFALPPGVKAKNYLPGVIIVKFKQSQQATGKDQTSAEAQPVIKLQSTNVLAIEKKFGKPTSSSLKRGNTVLKEADPVGLSRIYSIHIADSSKLQTAINELLQDARVEYAEPSYIYHTSYTPNDTSYGLQTWLSQVSAPQAWDITRNASGIIIAIVDSGSETTHPDLAANIYINTADPVNGIDDDGDGYIDNYYGWDFVGASGNNWTPDNDPNVKSDSTDHGVHVSGIASAVSDNHTGVASIAFNAKLMIVKTGADNDASSIYTGFEGVKYAADHGAQIINCSWGGSFSQFGQDIVNYAIDKGCLVIAAAGNSNTSEPDYPAGYSGVLAVANVNGNDKKSGSSNYGAYVSIAAPGTGITSTIYNGKYGEKSGTSMATPMVSSAAALVKSYRPELTMQQVGEQLRITSDNIDNINPAYVGMLGKGRLNVYRALTKSPPSIRYQKLTVTDDGSGTLPAGDTVLLYLDLKNFLTAATNVTVKLSTTNGYVSILNAIQTLPAIGLLETKSIGPFKVYIKPNTPDNSEIPFRLDYSANNNAYQDFELFNLSVALDYINITVNQVSTTLTSNGRVGYEANGAKNGLGFIYKDQSVLYEASLMIGTSGTRISNNVRSVSDNSNEDFAKKVKASRLASNTGDFEGYSEFDDSASPNPLNVYIRHRQLAYANDKYTIVEYEVTNQNSTDLEGVYLGMFTDWDINGGSDNITKFDAQNNLGYIYSRSGSIYAGVKLLTNALPKIYYPLSYQLENDFLAGDNFTRDEKFQTLSNGIFSTGLGENISSGLDVMFVSGNGPFTIPAGQSVRVAFAFIAGDNLTDIQNTAQTAQQRYATIAPLVSIAETPELLQNYPNPVTGNTIFKFTLPYRGYTSLNLYNSNGALVKRLVSGVFDRDLYTYQFNFSDLADGVYFYRLRFNNTQKTKKLIIAK